MSVRIFISYSRHDADFARGLEAQLDTHGFTVWLDTERLHMGEFWRQEIVQAIENCDYFLLLLSDHSIVSVNVVRELSLAESSARRILPVMLHEVAIPDTMKYQLAGLQFVLVDAARREEVIQDILEALSISTAAAPPSQDGSAPTAPPSPDDSLWSRSQLLESLTLTIGPMASLLLETTPEALRPSDVQALRGMVQQLGIDPSLLDDALNRSLLTTGWDATDSATPSLANEACLAQWFRLQIGPIAEVIWDGPLRQALRQAPHEARVRLEGLGIDPTIVDELLRRCAGNSEPNLRQTVEPPRQAHG
ncbi:MAG: hypothetical protein RLZZ117_2283 [Cyanobacteriota bacterium]|jgi:hypothetical protein